MISVAAEELVRRMLADGKLSQRGIARAIGVSRTTVDAIARGTRPAFLVRVTGNEEFFNDAQPAERCPGCGGLVYLPCHACFVRDFLARQPSHCAPM